MQILETLKKLQLEIYDKCDLKINSFFPENESSEYFAHSFTIKGRKGLFRIAKKTPTKSGWFVTIWKRGSNNIIAPYEESDKIDFVIVAVCDDNNMGEFIFPKNILIKKNIFSTKVKSGKRAIRVYTPWDKTESAQSAKTQRWQSKFFIDMRSHENDSILKVKSIYDNEVL